MLKKAVILAAGKGKRMGDLTRFLPKPLIPINNRPFLYYVIQNLVNAGLTDLCIVVHHHKEEVEKFVKEHHIKATLIDQGEPLGTAHAIKVTKDFVKHKNFIVVMGDNYYSMEDIQKILIDDDYCYVSGLKHTCPEKYGVIVKKGDFLVKMPEKPKEFVSDLINIAMYKFTPEIFGAIDTIGKSSRGEYEINDAILALANRKKVKVIQILNDWIDLGCPEDIPKAEAFFKSHQM
jgi:dTDP-glucose pyrophosphorylase